MENFDITAKQRYLRAEYTIEIKLIDHEYIRKQAEIYLRAAEELLSVADYMEKNNLILGENF
jgi:hypothetical protein